MTLRNLQTKVADFLNDIPDLRDGGCRAFAEDVGNIYAEAARVLQETAGVVAIVATPDIDGQGGDADHGILCHVNALAVSFTERPALNRKRPGAVTALEAAQIAALAMTGEQILFDGIRQSFSGEGADVVLTATATFKTSINLTTETEQE